MKILIVGGGGREHALAWKLARDSRRPDLFCAPGNGGTDALATNVPIGAEDIDALDRWAADNRPDLTVVGPEAPLCAGLADRLQANGLRVFGPTAAAARLEGSKAFAKDVMNAAGVPTARAWTFDNSEAALQAVRREGAPIVVKADGLAAGKGVFVCETLKQAESAIRETMVDGAFGSAGRQLVVEECLQGEEASILALVDGEHIVPLASSQDHKRIFDGDRGPNTGGMGAYSPAPIVTDALWPQIHERVLAPTITELRRRGITYRGVLYAGLMINHGEPKVLEFNCRFGDPETQAVLPRLRGDLLPAMEACIDGTLSSGHVDWVEEPCVSVVMAAGGYPGRYVKGAQIDGTELAGGREGVVVFHAGTERRDGVLKTAGGRVLAVSALGPDLPDAVRRAYAAVADIHFEGAQYRKDIAARALTARG